MAPIGNNLKLMIAEIARILLETNTELWFHTVQSSF